MPPPATANRGPGAGAPRDGRGTPHRPDQRPGHLRVRRRRTRLDHAHDQPLPLRPGVVGNTQAAYTSVWAEDPPGRCKQNNAFALVAAHLEMARRDPVYKFVLAEVDYLKPYFDAHPQDRAELLSLLAAGRVEIMGGTYNEPNTNPDRRGDGDPELRARHRFQRDVLAPTRPPPGSSTCSATTRSSRHGRRRRPDVERWARGRTTSGADGGRRRPARMQFRSEFEWIARPARPADALHARALRRRLVDGFLGHAGRGRGGHLRAVPRAEVGGADPQRAVAGGHRLHPAQRLGHRHPPGLERALHLAAVRLRAAE